MKGAKGWAGGWRALTTRAPDRKTLYDTLGVSPNATPREIRTQFLRLSLKLHPDRNPGEERRSSHDRFVAVGEAYRVLSHAGRRREYDATLPNATRVAQRSSPDANLRNDPRAREYYEAAREHAARRRRAPGTPPPQGSPDTASLFDTKAHFEAHYVLISQALRVRRRETRERHSGDVGAAEAWRAGERRRWAYRWSVLLASLGCLLGGMWLTDSHVFL